MKRYIPSHNADSSVQTVICKAQSVDSGEARCKNEQRGYPIGKGRYLQPDCYRQE